MIEKTMSNNLAILIDLIFIGFRWRIIWWFRRQLFGEYFAEEFELTNWPKNIDENEVNQRISE